MIAPVPDHLRTLFLGNLPYYCNEYDVLSLFRGCGQIESVRLIKKNQSNENLGYGFITFENYEDAVVATFKLHGQLILGRNIRLVVFFILICFVKYNL
jgi:RNA recognition motif-containing protein